MIYPRAGLFTAALLNYAQRQRRQIRSATPGDDYDDDNDDSEALAEAVRYRKLVDVHVPQV